MKKMLWVAFAAFFSISVNAQFNKASLQATGLTCAMCSNAINKALQKVPFVESVKSDIKNSSFSIVFRQNAAIDISALKQAVEDAGFSVGGLQLTGTFNDIKIPGDQPVKLGNGSFYFLDVSNRVLNGEQTIRVLDKDFVTAKEFKKYSADTKIKCQQTDAPEGERVYHVTI